MIDPTVNFETLLNQANIWFARQTRINAWFKAIASVLQTINGAVVPFTAAVDFRLDYTGQIVSLEHYLNEVFDSVSRRCFIEDTSVLTGLVIRKRTEGVSDTRRLVIRKRSESVPAEDRLVIRRRAEYTSLGGFVVHMPDDLGALVTEERVRKEVDRFRAAGTTYSVVFESL